MGDQTIMPCDLLLVMDGGQIVQQGTPLELINEEGGPFQSLCRAGCEEEYGHLRILAEKNGGGT